jgi:transcriptional regulator with PAS, ATPase and Fis domain
LVIKKFLLSLCSEEDYPLYSDIAPRWVVFDAYNCGAIPRELIASELFGYEEGAFTGARKGGNPGKFELADGGTIFLDEIGEMPLELQTALLRVLEQKAITRVGGTDLIPVNVRIIAATNKNLLAEIEKGNFRRDLFYRLNVIAIRTIPLRERKTDIKPLALHFMRKVADQIGKKIETVDEEIWERFITYNWPGNVRELYNAVERIVNIASNNYLGVDLLPEEIKEYGQKDQIKVNGKKFGREELTTLIKMYNGNISKVAKELGIARTTVYRMMWKYNIQRSSAKIL